jgi:hypothetical protein
MKWDGAMPLVRASLSILSDRNHLVHTLLGEEQP